MNQIVSCALRTALHDFPKKIKNLKDLIYILSNILVAHAVFVRDLCPEKKFCANQLVEGLGTIFG